MPSVEITVLSGENLRIGKKPVKKHAFVTIWTDSKDRCCTTKLSMEDGSNPTWNDKLSLDLQPTTSHNNGYVTLEVHCKASSGNSKLVGGVNVPVSDLIGNFLPRNHLQFLSYRLRDPTGDRNGIVNISVKLTSPQQQPYNRCSQDLQPATLGVPIGENKRFGGAVATGVPAVLFAHHRSRY